MRLCVMCDCGRLEVLRLGVILDDNVLPRSRAERSRSVRIRRAHIRRAARRVSRTSTRRGKCLRELGTRRQVGG